MRKDTMPRPLSVLILLLVATSWGQSPSATPPASQHLPSQATVDSFMQHWFGYDSTITWKIASIRPSDEAPGFSEVAIAMEKGGQQQQMLLYVAPDEKYAFSGDVIPFGADPFAAARHELEASRTGIARGPEKASLTIVEFSDLECPHCKQAQPTIEKLQADFPSARFVFQQFPLEAAHPWAFQAATWAQCIGKENNAAFWKFVSGIYDDQLNIDPQNAAAKMKEHATAAGADAAKAAACAASPETTKLVHESQELGRAVGVAGTPTLFLNGRKVGNLGGLPYEVLKELAQYSEKQASK